MNKMIKFLLSVVIVCLSALVVPLMGHSEDIKAEPVAVQEEVIFTGVSTGNAIEEHQGTINFEFYLMCLRVTSIISLFKM